MADDNIKQSMASLSGAMAASQTAVDSDDEGQFSDIQKEMRSRYELLPEDIKKAIVDDGYQMKLFTIAKELKFTYEELGTIELDTTMVLLGMLSPTEYRDEIQVDLKKNDAEIDALVKAINEQVFAPIRASLDRVFSGKKDAADFLPDRDQNGQIIAAAPAPLAQPLSPTAATSTIPAAPSFAATPIPPKAAPAPMPNLTLSAQDRALLEKTGIIINTTPAPAPSSPISSRSDLLQGIENPTKAPSASIIADKLKTTAPVMPATKTTDYTVAKPTAPMPMTPPATGPKGSDPYRESIS